MTSEKQSLPVTGTPRRRLDEMVARLQEGAAQFARLTLDERIALAGAMQAGISAGGRTQRPCLVRREGNSDGDSGRRRGVDQRMVRRAPSQADPGIAADRSGNPEIRPSAR